MIDKKSSISPELVFSSTHCGDGMPLFGFGPSLSRVEDLFLLNVLYRNEKTCCETWLSLPSFITFSIRLLRSEVTVFKSGSHTCSDAIEPRSKRDSSRKRSNWIPTPVTLVSKMRLFWYSLSGDKTCHNNEKRVCAITSKLNNEILTEEDAYALNVRFH